MVAEVARSLGILTIGIVTLPFNFEGMRRGTQARQALERLRANVDTLITIPNDKLLTAVGTNTPIEEAFTLADDVLRQGVRGISDIVQVRPTCSYLSFAQLLLLRNPGSHVASWRPTCLSPSSSCQRYLAAWVQALSHAGGHGRWVPAVWYSLR